MDLTTGNTISSNQVANLSLQVNGKGVVGDAIRRPNFCIGFCWVCFRFNGRMMMKKLCACPGLSSSSRCFASGAAGTRLKEIASLEGRPRQPIDRLRPGGGTERHGRQSPDGVLTADADQHARRMGVVVDPTAISVRNMAAVMVTATLPPFAQPGTQIDITAAAIGDASNLQGGCCC